MRMPKAWASWMIVGIVTLALPCAAARAEIVAPPPATPTMEPEQSSFGHTSCVASAPRELGRSTLRNLRLVVAAQPSTGPSLARERPPALAAWSGGESAIMVRPIGLELGATQTVSLDQGMNVSVLAPASGGRFMAITVGALCGGGRARGYACLRAIGLAADGTAIAPAYAPEPSEQQLEIVARTPLRAADGTPTGIALATVSRWGGADISLFRLGASGEVVVEPHPIHADGPGDSPIHALYAEGEQVVATGRQETGATDEEGYPLDRPFVLALGQRRQPLAPAVPASARLRWGRVQGAELQLFYTMPHERVRWLRISTVDGSYQGGTPSTIEPRASLPASPISTSLRVVRGQLVLERGDLRGRTLGTMTIAPARGRAVIASAWDGTALEVVWATRAGREWVISESRVSCMP
ncbi:MAG: hypothetical protein U0353_20635 [Sandaracinus sp.]